MTGRDDRPEQLRSGLRETRRRVDDTIGAIEDRLSPAHLARRSGEVVRHGAQQAAGVVRRGLATAPERVGAAAGRASLVVERLGAGKILGAAAGAVGLLAVGLGVRRGRQRRRPPVQRSLY